MANSTPPTQRRTHRRPPGPDEYVFNRREVAQFADVSLASVSKAIEHRAVSVKYGAKREVLLDAAGLMTIAVLNEAALPLPKDIKQRLGTWVRSDASRSDPSIKTFEVSPAVAIFVSANVRRLSEEAQRYAAARERWIEVNPDLKGGEPVLRGTRITAHGVAQRLDGGETLDELREDYPDLPVEAFETARIYARAHPRRGRPTPPWRRE